MTGVGVNARRALTYLKTAAPALAMLPLVFLTLRTAVIPGRATRREPHMCNCTSGNPEVTAREIPRSCCAGPGMTEAIVRTLACRGATMSKPIPHKAEIALEYPDKFYVGTFEHTSR